MSLIIKVINFVQSTILHNAILHVCCVEISSRLRRRYPSLASLVRCGLVSGGEVARLGPEAAWWRPLVWSAELLTEKEDLYRYGKGGRALLQQTYKSLHLRCMTSVHIYTSQTK